MNVRRFQKSYLSPLSRPASAHPRRFLPTFPLSAFAPRRTLVPVACPRLLPMAVASGRPSHSRSAASLPASLSLPASCTPAISLVDASSTPPPWLLLLPPHN